MCPFKVRRLVPPNHRGSPLRLKEFDLYSYLGHLENEKAGATAASSFIEALRFLDSVAVLTCADLGRVLSPRITGFAHQQFLRKAPLKQKDPMPCLVIAELEKLLLRQEDMVQICILGQLLWCFHAASRWSDALRLKSLKLEKVKDVALITGEALGSKTSLTKEAQTRLLPYVAIGTGVNGLLWAEKWLDARVARSRPLSSVLLMQNRPVVVDTYVKLRSRGVSSRFRGRGQILDGTIPKGRHQKSRDPFLEDRAFDNGSKIDIHQVQHV